MPDAVSPPARRLSDPGWVGKPGGQVSRRGFLKLAGAGAVLVGAGGLAAACGSSIAAPDTTPAGAAKPKRGGTLKAALSGGDSSDTLNPLVAINNVDFSRINNVYEGLATYDDDAVVRNVLAEEMAPNADATEWTVRLRSDVTWHNGKALGAEDLAFTIRQILNPKAPGSGAPALSPVDAKALTMLDRHTLRIPCTSPFASFPQVMAGPEYFQLVPVGFDPKHPVGTGPFKVASFTPGVQSTLVRNGDYWQSGLPYLDAIVTNDFTDETSQVNALLSGEVDVANLLSSASIAPLQTGSTATLISDGGGWTPFTMRVDRPPFNDVRVRQAMRLIVDRQQMLELVFGGHGTVGNDVFSIWDPEYDRAIPQRQQDIAQAKFLLKQAGQEDLAVQLVTSDIAQGVVRAAEVFQQQATAAGVTVNLQNLNVTEFYGPNYLKWVFAQDYWYYTAYLAQVALATLPSAPYNECHFDDAVYNSLYAEALRQTDATKQAELAHEMQLIDYDQGGYIIANFPPVIDGYNTKVHGLRSSRVGISLGNYDFAAVWLD